MTSSVILFSVFDKMYSNEKRHIKLTLNQRDFLFVIYCVISYVSLLHDCFFFHDVAKINSIQLTRALKLQIHSLCQDDS